MKLNSSLPLILVGSLFLLMSDFLSARPVVVRPLHRGKVIVNPPGPGAVVVKRKPVAPVVRYAGPRNRVVVRSGPLLGTTLLVAPYHVEHVLFVNNPVEVAVQIELKRLGYYAGPIDGDIGAGSVRAISQYQQDHGLVVTGIIDRPLLRSLGLIS